MKSDFKTMTMQELKKYVLEHRNDQTAFRALMEHVDAQPHGQIYGDVDIKQFSELLENIATFSKVNTSNVQHYK